MKKKYFGIVPLLLSAALFLNRPADEARVMEEKPDVYIKSNGYNPPSLHVPVNYRVVWINGQPGTGHSVTSDEGIFDSGDMWPYATFNYTFTSSGYYPYHCMHHPWERGEIIVK